MAMAMENQQQKQGFSWIRGKAIGAGSFGTVSLAVNRADGSLFAVKSAEMGNSGEIAALENERQILESLDCPQVIRCLGGDDTAAEPSKPAMKNVFLEYMPGGSLVDLMAKLGGKLDESLVRIYTRGILQGLEFLHRSGIVHCDIKGKNILVGCESVKLADFGAAKRVGAKSMAGGVKGTPLWMAPEAVRQEEQGAASDIWSLGCTVIEMLTGKAPWGEAVSGSNPMVAMYKIACSNEIPELPSFVSSAGRDFLAKCLCRDPCSRASAEELLRHPFVSGEMAAEEKEEEEKIEAASVTPISPRSPLDFSRFFSIKSSATGDLPRLEEDIKWIVVRSPQGQPPAANAFEHLSDFAEELEEEEEEQASASPAISKAVSKAEDEENSIEQPQDCGIASGLRVAQEPESSDCSPSSSGSSSATPLFLGDLPISRGGIARAFVGIGRTGRSIRLPPRATVPRSRGRIKLASRIAAGGISARYSPRAVVTPSLKDTGTNLTLENRVALVFVLLVWRWWRFRSHALIDPSCSCNVERKIGRISDVTRARGGTQIGARDMRIHSRG
ncbi:mitogen-activated protein kinase kinase kinase 17 [Selaginella moellendorffii]|nr:mitogen-activated protein kinase kinase kinase 17 [Selaginella moellendorffii]|eukprot:XP_002967055.2 mitogen-activated protein kinase kinase kinase 17 [Selaginella moellendorffii]